MGLLEETLRGKSLADYTNTQLRLALGAVLYTNTADMWKKYLNQIGYTGDVSQMLQKYYVDYSVPSNFRNYINAGASIFNPQHLFLSGEQGYVYDLNDQFAEKTAYRRNLLTWSEQFNNAAWLKQANGTGVIPVVTPNFDLAPDGTSTADRIVFDLGATPASAYSRVGQFNLTTNTSIRSKSIWLKTTDGSTKTIYFQGPQTSNTVLTVTGVWTRFSVSDSTPTVSAYSQMQFGLDSTTSTTASILAWGAQVEENAPAATEYQRVTDWNTELLAAFPNTTLYLDSAGTTAATVNGAVGLVLDKSKGLALGAELLSSGAIGVTGTATAATYNTSTGAGTVTRVDGSNQSFVTFTGLSSTSFYRVTIQNTGSNILSFRQGTFASTILGDIGVGQTKTFTSIATTSQLTVTMSPVAGSGSFVISTFKDVAGNHAYQATAGSRPILRGTPTGSNLVTNGDFTTDVSGWLVNTGVNNVVLSAGTALSTMLATGQGILRTSVPTVSGRTYRRRMTVVSNTLSNSLLLNIRDVTSSTVITTNTLLSGVTGTFDIYFTATGSSTWIEATTANPTNSGGTYSIDNVSVFDVSAGFVQAPYALQFDGVDDFLQTASVDFTATDKMTICHGVRKLSDAATAMLVELSVNANTNNGSFYLAAPISAASDSYTFSSKGTIFGGAQASGYAAPITSVVCGTGDISGDRARIRVNGVQITETTTDQGTGNYGNYPFYFGRRGGTTLPYNGLMFSSVCVGKTVSATELTGIERWVNARTGAY